MCLFLLSDGKRKKKVLFHSQFQKSELPLSYMRIFLEDPLAALSGSLWDCRSERKMLCRESQTPDVEKKRHFAFINRAKLTARTSTAATNRILVLKCKVWCRLFRAWTLGEDVDALHQSVWISDWFTASNVTLNIRDLTQSPVLMLLSSWLT